MPAISACSTAGGRRHQGDARAQPLHEGPVRLGRASSQAAVDYHREERTVGRTKFNYWKLWTLAIDGITSASTVPLRIWSYLGGVVALFALGYAVFIIVRTLTCRASTSPGYASLMVAILFLGGLQLLSLGVLGEYVGRILTETKRRPLYVVREKIGIGEAGRPDGARRLRPHGRARPASIGGSPRAAGSSPSLIERDRRTARAMRASSSSAAAPATISTCSRASAGRGERARRRGARRSPASGSAARSAMRRLPDCRCSRPTATT